MAYYTDEYSKFPYKIMDRHIFKDVDDSIGSIVNQIKILQAQGKYDKINEIIQNNKDALGQYIFGSEYINRIDDETRNLEIFAKSRKQSIYYSEEEPEWAITLDVWIGGHEDISV